MALTQTLVVIACGLFVGTLGFVVTDERLGADEFASGIRTTASLIAESVNPFDHTPSREAFVASSVESIHVVRRVEVEATLVFADLPVTPLEETASSTVETPLASDTYFSDEVVLMLGEGGEEYVVPVFRNDVQGEERFVVTPVNAQQN